MPSKLKARSWHDDAERTEWESYWREARHEGMPLPAFGLEGVREKIGGIDRWQKALAGGNIARIKQFASGVKEWMEDVNDIFENAFRLSFYVTLRKDGMSPKRAAHAARGLMNFERKGYYSSTFNALYMFANASIQTPAKMAEVAKINPRAAFAAAGSIATLGFLASLWARHFSNDDDDGENLWDSQPGWRKRSNIMLPNAKGDGFWGGPLSWGWGIFYVFGQQIEHVVSGTRNVGQAAGEIALTLVDTLNPLGSHADPIATLTPTAAQPFMEILRNKDFTGRPIMPTRFPGMRQPDSQLFFKGVAPEYRVVANVLNRIGLGTQDRPALVSALDISPETLEHFGDFIMGGIGRTFRRGSRAIEKLVNDEAVEANDIPLTRRFVFSPLAGRFRTRYYEHADKVEQAQSDLKRIREREGDRAAAEYKSLHPDLTRPELARKLKASKKAIGSVMDRANTLQGKERRDELAKLEDVYVDFNRFFLEKVKKGRR